MSCDLETKLAEVLHCTPHFGAARAQFLSDARTTDNHSCVVAQQANDAAQTLVSGTVWLEIHAGWRCADDNKIMRERRRIGQGKMPSSPRMPAGHAFRQ